MDRKMNADIEKLTQMMTHLTHQERGESNLTYHCPLTEKFLAEAEKSGRRWFSFGFDEWLRAGQWWMMSSQGRLRSISPDNSLIPIQPYADLLKASAILLDILPRHPSIRLWDPTKEYLQFRMLAEMLRRELEMIDSRALQRPEINDVCQADLGIWADIVQTVQLRPDLRTTGPATWESGNEETIFQGFGSFVYDPEVKPESCLILILVSKTGIDQARIVAQNQRGAELASLRVNFDLFRPEWSGEAAVSCLSNYYDCLKPLGDGIASINISRYKFSFSAVEDFEEFSRVLRGIIFCQNVDRSRKDHNFLHGIILMFELVYGNRLMIKREVESCHNRPCLEYEVQKDTFLDFVKASAADFLDNSAPSDAAYSTFSTSAASNDSFAAEGSDTISATLDHDQAIFFWAYDLLALLATLQLPLTHFKFVYPQAQHHCELTPYC
jgi:hypothetical protein